MVSRHITPSTHRFPRIKHYETCEIQVTNIPLNRNDLKISYIEERPREGGLMELVEIIKEDRFKPERMAKKTYKLKTE
jgi:hypothetical protein